MNIFVFELIAVVSTLLDKNVNFETIIVVIVFFCNRFIIRAFADLEKTPRYSDLYSLFIIELKC